MNKKIALRHREVLKIKRFLAVVSFLSLLSIFIGTTANAESQVVDVPGFAVLEYPKLVKLSKSNCQNVTIKYEINEELNLDGAALLVQLGSIKRKTQIGYTTWFGNIAETTTLLPMPMIGGMKVKVCKKDWKLKDQKFIGVKPGYYDVYIAYGTYQVNGSVQKEVITQKIKFIN